MLLGTWLGGAVEKGQDASAGAVQQGRGMVIHGRIATQLPFGSQGIRDSTAQHLLPPNYGGIQLQLQSHQRAIGSMVDGRSGRVS